MSTDSIERFLEDLTAFKIEADRRPLHEQWDEAIPLTRLYDLSA